MSQHESAAGPAPISLPRSSGLLLHITSLPSPYGIGDLGPRAYRFADFLADTGQRIWQVLPLVPVGLGNSPYSSPSTFALNPQFVSPDLLVKDGLVDEDFLEKSLGRSTLGASRFRVDFEAVHAFKATLLQEAYERFKAGETPVESDRFDRFCTRQGYWLDDYALFVAIKKAHDGAGWTHWAPELASRDPQALRAFADEHAAGLRNVKFNQFVVFDQWRRLKRYCNRRDVSFFGDLPIYVAHDSADVWAHPDLFHLDAKGRSTVVAGVPPDYFSETGQRWGNPIYRWDVMKENGYEWWTRRLESVLQLTDFLRLDHFRGFAGYWEIPADEETAVNGRWADGPGEDLFRTLEERLGPLPLVAEDLGLITPDVKELMAVFHFPGMAVLQFAFGEDADHPFLPHSHDRNLVAYTGTHDNDTFLGWWRQLEDDPDEERTLAFARAFLGLDEPGIEEAHWAAMRAVMGSPADYVVFPLQDLLGLGSEARMNTPGRGDGNWAWRFDWDQLTDEMCRTLKRLTALYGRSDQLDEVLQPFEHSRR